MVVDSCKAQLGVDKRLTRERKKERKRRADESRRELSYAARKDHLDYSRTAARTYREKFKDERSKRASLYSGDASSSQFPLSSPWQLALPLTIANNQLER